MITRVYDCNLHGVDVMSFKRNPIVVRDWQWTPESVVGRARILPGKIQVRVTFIVSPPKFEHYLATSTVVNNFGDPQLIGLALMPVYHEPEAEVGIMND